MVKESRIERTRLAASQTLLWGFMGAAGWEKGLTYLFFLMKSPPFKTQGFRNSKCRFQITKVLWLVSYTSSTQFGSSAVAAVVSQGIFFKQ